MKIKDFVKCTLHIVPIVRGHVTNKCNNYILEFFLIYWTYCNIFDVDRIPRVVTISYHLHFCYCGHLQCPILYDDGSLIHVS